MTKRIYKIIETIGIMLIVFLILKLFPYLKNILGLLFKISLPFLISFTVAFIIEPLIEKMEKKNIKRKYAIIFISIIFVLLIFLFFKFLIPLFIKQLEELLKVLPDYFTVISEKIEVMTKKYDILLNDDLFNANKILEFINIKLSNLIDNLSSFIQKIFSYIIIVFVIPILTIYFMKDYKKIELFIKESLIQKRKNEVYDILSKIKFSLHQYFRGVFIVMFLFTIVSTIVFMFLKIDYPLLFGFIIGITDVIPYFGPYIGGFIVGIFVLVSRPEKLLFVVISIVVLQIIESNLLVPKIQSKTLKTNPILVILSVTFFGEIMGIFGMIIAVPLEKTVEIIVNSYIKNKKT